MTNKKQSSRRMSLLGRSRPGDRLSRADRQALEGGTQEAPAPAKPAPAVPAPARRPPASPAAQPAATGAQPQRATQRNITKRDLKFRWTAECPGCGAKVGGSGNPEPGQRLCRCGRCKLHLYLERG